MRQSSLFFCFSNNAAATTEIYTLSLHDALPIFAKLTKIDDEYVARIERHVKLTLPQISSGHLNRFFYAQHREHRGRDVFERATFAQLHADVLFVDQVKGNGIGGVRCVWISGQQIDHLL